MDTEHIATPEADDAAIADRRRTDLSEEKKALLRARLEGRVPTLAAPGSNTIPIRPAGAQDVLSYAQQRLWFLDQLVPGSPFYTESSALRFEAVIDPQILERTINAIVARHELLRTTIHLRDGRPVPELSASLRIPLTQIDLAHLPADRMQAEVLGLATAEARQPFDLARGPLLRTTLLHLGNAQWVFLLSMHHIVCDGWSSAVFSRELAQIYTAFALGRPCPLPDLSIQYADFAHWQRGWLRGETLAKQLAYWAGQLRDLPAVELPADRPRPAIFSYLGRRHAFTLSGARTAALEKLGQSEGATLFMTLLAGFKTVLHRLTGQEDLVVGTPVANRSRAELEPLIGFFVNILVMRSDLSGEPSHRDVVRRVRATALGAYDHQDLPFEELVDALQPERDLARNPLFQIIFQLHADQTGATNVNDQALALIEVDRATVKFDLRLEFSRTADGLRGAVEYSTDLFDPERIERFVEYLQQTYDDMARAPDERIGARPLVRGEERALIAKWGRETRPRRAQDTIGVRFVAQAARAPDAVALIAATREFTYAEVRDRAVELALRLRAQGAGQQAPVALSSSRSVDAVIAQLGIVLAGAAYLPLDLDDPAERLVHMLTSAGVRLAVGASDATRWRHLGLTLVPLVTAGPPPPAAELPPQTARPEDPAYVMYTSGSTGLPKGVSVPHRAVVRLVHETNFCALGPDETFLLLAPMTFDASTLEVWAPLLNGGKLVVHPAGPIELEELEASIQRNRVTTLWLTAGLFHQVIDNRPQALAGVHQLLAGGDVLSQRHVRAFLQDNPESRLINGYGPTENTTFTCCHTIDAPPAAGVSVPIGMPIRGGRIYVVDRYGHLAPIGVAGELCVAGDGLALGYVGESRLTAERFVPDPFNGCGQRMYRTGDLVRYLPDGDLEFLSRLDRQVKIRGFRVEPQEIETLLIAHPDVRDAAVVPRNDLGAGARLVAYVAPQLGEARDAAQSIWTQAETTVVENWRTLYHDLYAVPAGADDATFDITGWSSSLTGQAIPAGEMREWLHNTVARIGSCSARRVMEIGCGTGLLAFRLAPAADFYCGTDISAAVVARLGVELKRIGLADKIELTVREADDFCAVPDGEYDLVVLNSVAQYFPSAGYFKRVLDGAVRATAAGGRIFLGDLRSLAHLAEFHTGVQMADVDESVECGEVMRRVTDAMQLERELLLEPALFGALPELYPRIGRVDVQWKRGLADNELTNFRYDVTLHIDGPHQAPRSATDFDWRADALCIDRVREILADADEDLVTLRRVPNTRIAPHGAAWSALCSGAAATRVADLQALMANAAADPPLDAFWEAAEGTAFEALVGPAPDDAASCIVRYLRSAVPLAASCASPTAASLDWANFANNPMNAVVAERLVPGLRRHLADKLPDHLLPSVYVLLDTLPLTRNGKVDYAALPAPVRERSAVVTAEFVGAKTDTQKRLAEVWASVLGLDTIGVEDNFFELGGDSILCIQVISRAKSEGIHLTIKQLFENQTIAGLAEVATDVPVAKAEQGLVSGACALTPAQAWMFANESPNPNHFNQSIALQLPNQIDAATLDGALRALLRHHDGLRLRFRERDGVWSAYHGAAEETAVLERVDLSTLWGASQRRALEARCAELQKSLDIEHGPMLRAALFNLGPAQPARFLIVAHHLVIDGVSWRIVLEQLWQAYTQLANGDASALPAKTTALAEHVARLEEFAGSDALHQEFAYWLSVPPDEVALLAVDKNGRNTEGDCREVRVELDEDASQTILSETPRVFHTQINDVLLTAFARAMTRWSESPDTYFDLEGHGREALFPDVDLSRTVGWLTSIFPVRLRVDPAAPIAASLNAVRDTLLAIPRRGVGFGILRYLSKDAAVRDALADLPTPDVSFNYLGQFGGDEDGAIRPAPEDFGPPREPQSERMHIIEVDGAVAFGRLGFTWSYSADQYDAASIQEVADMMLDELRAVVEAVRSAEPEALRAEDFPAARMAQDDLERLLAKLNTEEQAP